MPATTNVTVKFLAAKDASFDKTSDAVKKSIEGLKNAQKVAETTGDTTALKAANAEIARMVDQLNRAKKEALELGAQFSKFKLPSLPSPSGTGVGGRVPSGSGRNLPDEVEASAKRASAALAGLRTQLEATAQAGTGLQRLTGLRTGALDLAKWRQENQALLSQVPQLRAEYQSVTGQLRIASAEARILSSAETKVAAEARKVAQEQSKVADAQKRADARAAIEAQKKLAAEARKAAQATKESMSSVADLGRRTGLLVGGAGLVLSGLAVSALKTASSFEQLQARLNSVVKNGIQANQLFQQAVTLASTTPFSVNGIVQATVSLQAFQVNARQTLPAVVALAAGMGRSVEDAAQIMGKALSGSLEGFESLRNEAGISNADLRRYGATLTSTGTLALISARDIDKAGAALLKIVQSRFGDAAEKQSKTLQGALSNVADSIERAGAAFGQSLVPVAQVGARELERFVNAFAGLPASTRDLIAFGVAGIGAFATLRPVVQGITGQFRNLTASLSGIVGSGLARFLSGATSTLVGFGLATEAADVACKLYLEHLKQLDDQVVNAAKSNHDAFMSARDYSNAINSIGGQQFITSTHSAQEAATGFTAALKNIPLPQLVGGLQAAGFTFKQLERDIETNRSQTAAYAAQQKQLNDLLAHGGNNGAPLLDKEFAGGDLRDKTVNVAEKGLAPLFENRDVVTVKELRDKVKELGVAIGDLQGGATVLDKLSKAWKGFSDPMNQAVEASKKLSDYLEFSGKAKDLLTLTDRLKVLDKDLDNFRSKAKLAGLPVTEAGAIDRLKVAKGDEIEFQKAFIKRIEERKQAEAALVTYQQELAQERITQLDRLHAREVSDSDATLDSKRSDLKNERTYLEQRLALVDGAVREEDKLTKELNTLNRQKPNSARESAIEDVQQRLKVARQAADEQVETQKKLRDNKKATLALEVQDAQQALDETTKSSLDFVKDLKENGSGSPEILRAYDRVLVRLGAWREAHEKLINQSPALQKAFDGIKRQVEGGARSERGAQRAENLRGIQGQVGEDLAGEVSLAEKLATVKNAIAKINNSIASGTVERQAGEAAVLGLEKQQAQLLKQQEQQQAQFAQERLNIQRSAIDQEIAILEQRKTAGENVETQLMALRQERLQAALDAIALEADAELKAKGDKEQVAFKQQAAIKALLRQEYLDQASLYKDEESAAEEHQKKLEGIRSNRIGGSRSPIQSADEAFADLSSLEFDLDSGQKAFAKRKRPSVFDIAAKLNLDQKTSQSLQDVVQDPIRRQTNLRPVSTPTLSPFETPLSRIAADARRNFTPSEQLSDQINQAERAKKEAFKRPGGNDFNAGHAAPEGGSGTRQTTNMNLTVNGTQISASDSKFKEAVLTVYKAAYGDAALKKGVG